MGDARMWIAHSDSEKSRFKEYFMLLDGSLDECVYIVVTVERVISSQSACDELRMILSESTREKSVMVNNSNNDSGETKGAIPTMSDEGLQN